MKVLQNRIVNSILFLFEFFPVSDLSPSEEFPAGTGQYETMQQATVLQPTIIDSEEFLSISVSHPHVVEPAPMEEMTDMESCVVMEMPEIHLHSPIVQQIQPKIIEPRGKTSCIDHILCNYTFCDTLYNSVAIISGAQVKPQLKEMDPSVSRSDDDGTPSRQRPKLLKSSRIEEDHDVPVMYETVEPSLVRLETVTQQPLVMMGDEGGVAKSIPVEGQMQVVVPRSIVLEAISEETPSSSGSAADPKRVTIKPRSSEDGSFVSVDELIGERKAGGYRGSSVKGKKDKFVFIVMLERRHRVFRSILSYFTTVFLFWQR